MAFLCQEGFSGLVDAPRLHLAWMLINRPAHHDQKIT